MPGNITRRYVDLNNEYFSFKCLLVHVTFTVNQMCLSTHAHILEVCRVFVLCLSYLFGTLINTGALLEKDTPNVGY